MKRRSTDRVSFVVFAAVGTLYDAATESGIHFKGIEVLALELIIKYRLNPVNERVHNLWRPRHWRGQSSGGSLCPIRHPTWPRAAC